MFSVAWRGEAGVDQTGFLMGDGVAALAGEGHRVAGACVGGQLCLVGWKGAQTPAGVWAVEVPLVLKAEAAVAVGRLGAGGGWMLPGRGR